MSAQHSVFKKNEKSVRMNLIFDGTQPQMTEEKLIMVMGRAVLQWNKDFPVDLNYGGAEVIKTVILGV